MRGSKNWEGGEGELEFVNEELFLSISYLIFYVNLVIGIKWINQFRHYYFEKRKIQSKINMCFNEGVQGSIGR